MDVRTIMAQRLKQLGLDGLCSPDCECACLVDDLAPCGAIPADCVAGKRIPCDCGGNEHEWHIQPPPPARRRGTDEMRNTKSAPGPERHESPRDYYDGRTTE